MYSCTVVLKLEHMSESLQGLLKHRVVGPALTVSEVRSAESDNAVLVSNAFSGGAHAAGPGMTLGELLFADKL